MKHLTLFETTAAYNAATLDLPNVSLIEENMNVTYNPYVAPETRVVAKYNVTSTSSATALRTNYEQNIFKSMEIDGVILDELVTEYTFDTTGVHTVKYELYDETKLGNQAPVFYNSNLVECIIPDSVTSIGIAAFINCTSLTRLNSDVDGVFNIPSGVTSIGNGAFQNCNSLTNIDIPSGVTSIGSNAFYNCYSLTNIVIPNSVTSIGTQTFYYCTSLTSCTIGDSVTSIGNQAFYNCIGLTSIDIPDSVTSIGNETFRYCSSLTSITSNRTTAPTIQSDTFRNVKTSGTLTVPSGSSGYDTWMQNANYYLGYYDWTKIEQ